MIKLFPHILLYQRFDEKLSLKYERRMRGLINCLVTWVLPITGLGFTTIFIIAAAYGYSFPDLSNVLLCPKSM